MSDSSPTATLSEVEVHELEDVVIRFAGDSGDGMQLTGTQFTNTSAVIGNDISTLPDFPAEIRAPAGTLAGVSGFQVHFASRDIYTPGDQSDVLVAMNPAALKVTLGDLKPGGTIIVNSDEFSKVNLRKAEYAQNPLEDGSLTGFKLIPVPLTKLNRDALAEFGELTTKQVDRSKNMFALGLVFWVYDRPLDTTLEWLADKFAKRPEIVAANHKALRAGYYYGETTEAFQTRYKVSPAALPAGTYRTVTGNEALALGLVTAGQLADTPLIYCSYPITPASDILHDLAALKHFDVRTFQAEDEIAAMGAAIGAAFGGGLAVTGTSGPGIALKSEAMNLGMMLELPMIIIDVQRGGPSTGAPTKTEQGDLLQVLFGRNGESPVPVIAPSTPSDCFETAVEAVRWAIRAMSPVIILSDGYLANGAEPWAIPDPESLEPIPVAHPSNLVSQNGSAEPFLPYKRNPETLARPWALPGTAGLEHRIGGLSKAPETGNVSYDPQHNEQMNRERAEKVRRLTDIIPPIQVEGDADGELLLLSWGSTYGAARRAVENCRKAGRRIAHVHLRYINPMPKDLGEVLSRFEKVLVPEVNGGQMALLIQGRYGRSVISAPKLTARPFQVGEIVAHIEAALA